MKVYFRKLDTREIVGEPIEAPDSLTRRGLDLLCRGMARNMRDDLYVDAAEAEAEIARREAGGVANQEVRGEDAE